MGVNAAFDWYVLRQNCENAGMMGLCFTYKGAVLKIRKI